MVLLRCAVRPTAPHSSDMDLPVPRRPLPTKTAIVAKSWNAHSHKVNATHWTETLKWHFYDVLRFPMTPRSYNTDSPAPRRPLPKKTAILVKSWNTHSHKVNATHWTETLKWYFYDALYLQWDHTRLISTRLFREDLSRRKQQFWSKSWNTHSRKVNATHWTETLKWHV